ncbi:MAG: RagB/SusD family nutrient uptake outer membrane protein [Salinivirgaceae bacterium]|nr:RagB/SusD family nutrient uptake outer membrane protein [Salinivirgaceae bacterium]
METIKIFAFAFIVLFISACGDDFLSTEPITDKTDGNYYSTPQEAQEALVGCYDALQLIWDGAKGVNTGLVAMPVAADVMSDLCFGGTGAGDGDGYPMMDEFDQTVSPADINMFEGNWIIYYKGIFRCNTLIGKLDQVNWGRDSSLRPQIEAEARFLRAFFYFDMVRMFERVPLLTKPTNDNVPQADPDDTYALITSDLLFAVENGNDLPYNQIPTTDYGHTNKWAAESLLARVYLYYTGYYGKPDLVGAVTQTQALAYLEDVITYSGHGLLSNFSDLWPAAANSAAADSGKRISQNTYAGETNKEVVFAIKYTYTSDWNGNTDGNHWLVMNGLRNASWAERGYGSGWGACTVPPEVYNNWDPADTRRDASIIAIEEEGVGYTTKEIKDVKEYTGYFTKKYIPTCDSTGTTSVDGLGLGNFMISQFQDYFCSRYADVLLMAAELGSPNALSYVNDVHTRAGLTPLSSVDKDVIYEERKNEFAFEGIRYWDLLRYDNTLSYAANKVSYQGTVKTGNVEVEKKINGNNLIKTRGLFQIPSNQITLSDKVLTQNPGWE